MPHRADLPLAITNVQFKHSDTRLAFKRAGGEFDDLGTAFDLGPEVLHLCEAAATSVLGERNSDLADVPGEST
ncbi:hypothetical protein D3C80_1645970 [compost metagenome]